MSRREEATGSFVYLPFFPPFLSPWALSSLVWYMANRQVNWPALLTSLFLRTLFYKLSACVSAYVWSWGRKKMKRVTVWCTYGHFLLSLPTPPPPVGCLPLLHHLHLFHFPFSFSPTLGWMISFPFFLDTSVKLNFGFGGKGVLRRCVGYRCSLAGNEWNMFFCLPCFPYCACAINMVWCQASLVRLVF